jgi:hypothetical protein
VVVVVVPHCCRRRCCGGGGAAPLPLLPLLRWVVPPAAVAIVVGDGWCPRCRRRCRW